MCPGRKASWELIVNTCKLCEQLNRCDEGKSFLKLDHKFRWSRLVDCELEELTTGVTTFES